MTNFKAKMHQIRFRLGFRPRPRWGSLQRSSRPPSWIWVAASRQGRGWAGEKEGRGGRGSGVEGKGGPPIYCWIRASQSLATPLLILDEGNLRRVCIDVSHPLITLRASWDTVYCNRSCGCVCVCGSVTTITRNCVHRSSPNWVCR